MVFSVKTYNNINQIGLKELGNHFQIDGDLAENPDAYIIRSQNLHDTVFPDNLKAIAPVSYTHLIQSIALRFD